MEFSNEIIRALNEICNKFGMVIDWSNDNAVPYLQSLGERIVKYQLVTATVGAIVTSILILAIIGFIIWGIRRLMHDPFSCVEPFMVVAGILIAGAIMILFMEIGDIISCMTFQEKCIIDFIQGYI